jgi:transcriptional regulator with XRE-family HTH domain
MDITAIVAENLSAWMAATPALDTLQKLEAKSGVGFSTIRRARKGEGNVTVENLAKIASAFGRSPAELLIPREGRTANLPSPLSNYLLPSANMQNGILAADSLQAYKWPFPLVSQSAFEALPAEARAYVQGCMKQAIDEAAHQFGTATRKRSA